MTDRGWKDTVGLADGTDKVSIYCKENDIDDWDREVEENGYKSRSEYLYELIQESRRYRERGFLSREHEADRVVRLKAQIERLEDELEAVRDEDNNLRSRLEDQRFIMQFLTVRYRSLDKLMEEVVDHRTVESAVRQPVEDTLYRLAADDLVEYRRGHGWRLTEKGELEG